MDTERIIELKTHVSNEVKYHFINKIRFIIKNFKELLWNELIAKLEPGFYDSKGFIVMILIF